MNVNVFVLVSVFVNVNVSVGVRVRMAVLGVAQRLSETPGGVAEPEENQDPRRDGAAQSVERGPIRHRQSDAHADPSQGER